MRTDRDQQQDELARLRLEAARYKALLSVSTTVSWTANADGRVTQVSEQWVDFTGMENADFAWIEAIHPEDRARVREDWLSAVRSGTDYRTQGRIWNARTKAWRTFQSRGVPVRDSSGNIVEWLGTLTDIQDTLDAQAASLVRDEVLAKLAVEQQRLQAALTATGAGVFDWNMQTGEVVWSDRYFRLMGISPGSARASYELWRSRIHPDDLERAEADVQRALRSEERYTSEYRVRTAEGGERFVTGHGLVLRDEAGTPIRMIGASVDVTSRVLAERAAREQARELASIYAAAPVGLCILDKELRYLRINERLARENGVSVADHLGRSVHEIVPDLGPQAERALREVLEGRELWGIELVGTSPAQPGVVRTWRENWLPYRDGEGQIVGVAISAEDVTEMKRAEAALKLAARQKDVFLATLSHELRNPLAPMRTALELLNQPALPADQATRMHAVLNRQLGRMALLIDDLMDAARVTQGKLELRPQRTTLRALIDTAVETALPLFKPKEQRLELEVQGGEVALEVDVLRIGQALANLLANASKYSPGGSRVFLRSRSDGETVTLEVSDEGRGFPPDTAEQMFEMFAQMPGAGMDSEGGLGIGLALVKAFVTLHGGTVSARSGGNGAGSTFTVRLPLRRTEAPAAPLAPVKSPSQERSLRVLVADDNRDSADVLKDLLDIYGHEVRVAYDGAAALTELRSFRPDVALLDLGMPEMRGEQVAATIRTEPWAARLVLIAISGWSQREDLARTAEAGFDAHLVKPVDIQHLLQLVGDSLQKRAHGARPATPPST